MKTYGERVQERWSPNELAGLLGLTLGTASYHVRVLRDKKFLVACGERRVRGAVEHFYRLTDAGRELLTRVPPHEPFPSADS